MILRLNLTEIVNSSNLRVWVASRHIRRFSGKKGYKGKREF
jgi:hypothetical protein